MRGRATALTVRMGPLALALLPLALFACGDDDGPAKASPEAPRQFGSELSGPEASQAEATLRAYFEARSERRWARACSYLAAPIRRLIDRLALQSESFPGTDCPSFIAFSTQKLPPSKRAALDRIVVDSVRADGNRGYVLYRHRPGERQQSMPIQAEGIWKLGAPSATPLAASSLDQAGKPTRKAER